MDKPVGKKVTSVSPIEGALGFISTLASDTARKFRDTALTDEVGDITLDTCCPTDTGVWETGILRPSVEGFWVILGQYDSQEEAAKGHKQWLAYVTENPKAELKDINNWNLPS